MCDQVRIACTNLVSTCVCASRQFSNCHTHAYKTYRNRTRDTEDGGVHRFQKVLETREVGVCTRFDPHEFFIPRGRKGRFFGLGQANLTHAKKGIWWDFALSKGIMKLGVNGWFFWRSGSQTSLECNIMLGNMLQ